MTLPCSDQGTRRSPKSCAMPVISPLAWENGGVGHPPPLNDPKMHGFDTFYGYINMYHAHNFYPEWLVADGKKVSLRNQVHEDYARPMEREEEVSPHKRWIMPLLSS